MCWTRRFKEEILVAYRSHSRLNGTCEIYEMRLSQQNSSSTDIQVGLFNGTRGDTKLH